MLHPNYPSAPQVDQWCDRLLQSADAVAYTATPADAPTRPAEVRARHSPGQFFRFEGPGIDRFYAYFQPAFSGGPAPLLVHLPGYGGELTMHPELTALGFNVLHVNPQGYFTPEGPDESKLLDGAWPVLPETVMTGGDRGYGRWYTDALVALRWAQGLPAVQANRVAFFGTSQGGGTALVMASIARGRGVKAVAADVPFLTNFPLVRGMKDLGAYNLAFTRLDAIAKSEPAKLDAAWHALGFTDTLSHAHRLTMPALLTAGGADSVCPPASIKSLFEALPATRSYTELAGQGHNYTVQFLHLARAWFGLYV